MVAQHESRTTLLMEALRSRPTPTSILMASTPGITTTPSVTPGYESIIPTHTLTTKQSTPLSIPLQTLNPTTPSLTPFISSSYTTPLEVPLTTQPYLYSFPQPIIHPFGYPPPRILTTAPPHPTQYHFLTLYSHRNTNNYFIKHPFIIPTPLTTPLTPHIHPLLFVHQKSK